MAGPFFSLAVSGANFPGALASALIIPGYAVGG